MLTFHAPKRVKGKGLPETVEKQNQLYDTGADQFLAEAYKKMAPRVVIILVVVCMLTAVAGGLVTAMMTKNIPTDFIFTEAQSGRQKRQVILRNEPVIVFRMDKISVRTKPQYCPAWYSSDVIHVLYKVIGWDSAAEYNRNYKRDAGKPWHKLAGGLRYFPNSFNTYFVKFHRLKAEPVRIVFMDAHRVSNGCGYLGPIPLLPDANERNTAIDVVTDLLFLPRIQNRANLSPTYKPPRPATM